MFEVKGLKKSIKGKEILKKVDFKIERGQIGVFLGGSGVGKTTLLRVLNNLESYDEGSFHLDGETLNLKYASRRHQVGMVFQHFNLFDHLSVEANVMLAMQKIAHKSTEEAKKTAHRLLEKYGLLEFATSSIRLLSGGQKQRLAIARSVAMNPEVICLDEPSSALDPLLTNQLAKYIAELAGENRIVLLSTHDMGLIKQFKSSLFFMEGGTIVESGHSDDCLSDSTKFPRLTNFILA